MTKNNQISITDACKLIGISRSTFYSRYLQTGLISKSKDHHKVFIDKSELARVFPDIKLDDTAADNELEMLRHENTLMEREIHYLRNEVKQLKINAERDYQREQNLQSTIQVWKLMLEHKTQQDKPGKTKKSGKNGKPKKTRKKNK